LNRAARRAWCFSRGLSPENLALTQTLQTAIVRRGIELPVDRYLFDV
jgi:hypothetical protein